LRFRGLKLENRRFEFQDEPYSSKNWRSSDYPSVKCDGQTDGHVRQVEIFCNYISPLIQHLLLTKSLQHSIPCPYALPSVPTLPLSRKSWHHPFSEGSSTKNNG